MGGSYRAINSRQAAREHRATLDSGEHESREHQERASWHENPRHRFVAARRGLAARRAAQT